MAATTLPKFNMENSETGCCPQFDPTGWDGEEFEFRDRPFVRTTTVNFMHIPLNMGGMIKKTFQKIQEAYERKEELTGKGLGFFFAISSMMSRRFFSIVISLFGNK